MSDFFITSRLLPFHQDSGSRVSKFCNTATLISEYLQVSEIKASLPYIGFKIRLPKYQKSPPVSLSNLADTFLKHLVSMNCFTFLLQATLLELCAASYVLETSYTSANWFDQFTFFTVCSFLYTIYIPVSWTYCLS